LPPQSIAHTSPAWSPDGRQLAYVEIANGAADVWVMQANGGHPVKLTANGASNTQPSWSPDGARIVFVSDKAGTTDLWLMNADGSNQQRLTTLPGQENSPRFSPAGDSIVFSETKGDIANLMVIGANGGDLRQLTAPARHDWEPCWGPAGIVFSSDRDTTASGWKIWAVNADGSGLRKLGDVFGHDPVWARDGRIVYTDVRSTSKALSTIRAFDPATGSKQVIVEVVELLR
jgi:Tol biopolymer transport system component